VEQTQGEGVVPLELGLYAELAGNRAAHHTVRVLAEDPLQPVLPERALRLLLSCLAVGIGGLFLLRATI